jgi:hypothetical protein
MSTKRAAREAQGEVMDAKVGDRVLLGGTVRYISAENEFGIRIDNAFTVTVPRAALATPRETPICEHDKSHVQAIRRKDLCHQCGTLHAIPEGAECLKAVPEVQQSILQIAMRAGITVEWVRENYIPIKRMLAAQPRKPEVQL